MVKLTEQQKEKLIDDMLDFFSKEMGISLRDIGDKRGALNTLMAINTNFPLGEYFYGLQDKLLSDEASSNAVSTRFDGATKKLNFCYIKADMLVYFGEKLLHVDAKKCVENDIIISAGVQVNEDFYNQLKQTGFIESYTKPYITAGYNLNCYYIAKILLNAPEQLNLCAAEIFKFAEKNKLKNIAIYVGNNGDIKPVFEKLSERYKQIKLVYVTDI